MPRRRGRPGGSSWSTQTMRGSLRNHESWRRAKRRVAASVRSRASASVSSPARVAAPRGSRSPAAPCGPPPARAPSRRLDLLDEAGVEHPRRPARSIRASSVGRSMSTPIWTVRGSAYSQLAAATRVNGRPVSAMTSRARTMRRPLSGRIRAAASGSTLAPAARAAPRAASSRELGLQRARAPPRRCRGTRSGRGSRGCRAPSRRPAPASPPRPRSRRSTARARRWNSATVGGLGHLEQVEQVVRDAAALGRRAAWRCRCPCRGRPASRRC